jgi:hypothetical protein
MPKSNASNVAAIPTVAASRAMFRTADGLLPATRKDFCNFTFSRNMLH